MSRAKREIPVAKVSISHEVGTRGRLCEHANCQAAAEFRAPKSRDEIDSYYWFCLDHVRAYNAQWDYFNGMSRAEIEHFQKEAVVGHRPTWRLGSGFNAGADDIHDPFDVFENVRKSPENGNGASKIDPRLHDALSVLDLDISANLQEIKMRYKQLVKRHHPDANGGDKAAEERFKSISEAYNFLLSRGIT